MSEKRKEVVVVSVLAIIGRLVSKLRREEAGFSTAELLGNAALGILALVAIWAVLQALGVDVVNWIR
ncbi:MAG: hypothetical protein ACRDQW_18890, partial [Haloechinothrix sp.]